MPKNRSFDNNDSFVTRSVVRIVALYAALSVLWILFSDQIVALIAANQAQMALLSTFKGMFFILVTSVLLAGLMQRLFVQLVRVAQASRENEERWKFALEGAGDGVWDWNVQSGEVMFSRRCLEMLGYEEGALEAHFEGWKKQVHAEDIDAALAQIGAYLNGAVDHYQAEFRMCCKDSSWKWILSRGMIVSRDAQGRPLRMIGTHSDITERKSALAALQASEANYRTLFNEMLDGFAQHEIICDEAGKAVDYRFLKINPAFSRMTGLAVQETVGHRVREVLPGLAEDWIETFGKVALDGMPVFFESYSPEFGKYFQVTAFQLAPRQFACIFADVTERKKAETDLRIAAAAFEAQDPMVITDADTIIQRVNRAFSENTGYAPEEVVGKTPAILRSSRHDAAFFRAMWESIRRTGGWQGEIWDRRKNGDEYLKWLAISAVKDDEGRVTHYIGVQYDITERKLAEEKIHKLANFDQLTGLPNRTLLIDRLRQVMHGNERCGRYGAFLLIDLDNFKMLNDTLGHDVGDQLLQQVAQRLKDCVRAEDTVSRFGGDEFVILLSGLEYDKNGAARRVDLVGQKILAALNQNYPLAEGAYRSTPSIGASLFEGQKTEIDTLLKQADLAMYRAKEAGRNTLRFFDPDMEVAVMKRAALEKDLRVAIEERQFVLHYQAQVVGGKITGAEALLRWVHPQRGLIPPLEFIPVAEETGMILPLGQWVLETACAQLARWSRQADMAQLTIAVNVSANQFGQTDFVDNVLSVLARSGANPLRLKLELTESMLVSNVDEVIEKMYSLKAKGIGFLLDDFGTGYSSLSYLKRLPLDHLKIDKSFVQDVLTDPNDASIARTIIALAHNLGIGVVAEGVENIQQRDFLAQAGCHAYQGYFYGRPLPIEDFHRSVVGFRGAD